MLVYLTLFPILGLLVVFYAGPSLYAFWLSLTNANMLRLEQMKFIGLANFDRLLKLDPVFWPAFRNTVVYAFTTTILGLPLALLVALGLKNLGPRLRRFFTFFYFAPYISPIVAVSVLFTWMFQKFGLFNMILESLGLPPQPFITASSHAMASLIGMVLWKDLGFGTILYLVGLLGIPNMYYEAAQIDGANRWRQFKSITLPLLARTTQFVAVMYLINGFKAFTVMHVITKGGPGRATTVLTTKIYEDAIVSHLLGRGSAVAVMLFIVILLMTLVQLKMLKAKWDY